MSTISHDICEEKCVSYRALAHKLFAGGGFSVDNDVCVCYFRDSIKSFKLGG